MIAVGDIHGCHDKLMKLMPVLEKEDKVIFLGDYIDRGEKSVEVMETVAAMKNAILLKGNHEVMAFEPGYKKDWYMNGGDATQESLALHDKDIEDYRWFYNKLQQYHIEETYQATYYFIHASWDVTRRLGDQHEWLLHGDWEWSRDAIYYREHAVKTWTDGCAVIGHTPLMEPYLTPHLIAIDTGAFAPGGKLTAVRLPAEKGEELKVFQA